MKQDVIVRSVMKLALVTIVGFTVACSSSGSGDDDNSVDTSISGNVVAAPVDGASVIVKDAAGINTLAGPVLTNSDGGYSIDPGSASSGTYIIESSGGTYTDEASGVTTTAGMLKAYVDVASLAAGSQVHLTPASTIVHDLVMTHGVELSKALSDFESTFGFAADSGVAPADVTSPPVGATNEERLAGLFAAAFSQLTENLGLLPNEQFELLKALAEDLAIGGLDGEGVSGPVEIITGKFLPSDIHNRISQALVDFHAGDNDNTGLDNDMIGAIVPFAKVVLTSNYKIEYMADAMPMMGKTEFTLRISNIGGGVATGLTVTMSPMMHMPEGRNHSTPMLGCTEMGTPGDYDCKLYYLMPSDSRGYWELKIDVAQGESATFYPHVMMDMGARVVLKDLNDNDDTTMEHNYFLFKENMTDAKDGFTVFLAYMKSMMMIPAVGATLETMPVLVQFSTMGTPDPTELPDANIDWIDADGSSEDGFWGAPITGYAGKIHARLFINDVLKTTDGKAPGVAVDPDNNYVVNEYATFMMMPMSMPSGM